MIQKIIIVLILMSSIFVNAQDIDSSRMLGLRTVAYEVKNLEAAITWYAKVFDIKPYVNTPNYVGFNIRGFELGLMPIHPSSTKGNNVLSYWGVTDIDSEYKRITSLGATPNTPIMDVGGGIRLGTVKDPFGNVLGLIYNPIFTLDP